MSFFLALTADQGHVPFPHAGTGTINTLVLALLSFIADLKPETVIFAMEEPEIAVPPHTQRRIAQYLLTKTTQAFVTSHSPFVIEKFEPSKTLLLARKDGVVTARRVSDATGLKDNDYKRFARSGLTECMLGRAAIVVEGVTELHALPVVARRMEEADPNLQPLDIAGVAFFDADGESNMPKFGKFFKTLGLRTFAFYDFDYKKKRKPSKRRRSRQPGYQCRARIQGLRRPRSRQGSMSPDRLWSILSTCEANDENGSVRDPRRSTPSTNRPSHRHSSLGRSGAEWALRLFEECELHRAAGYGHRPVSGVGCSRCSPPLTPPTMATVTNRGLLSTPTTA